MKVEHGVCSNVFSYYSSWPQFLHEEHLVANIRRLAWCKLQNYKISQTTKYIKHTIPCLSCSLEPFSQVAYKVKEEISFWDTDH